MTDITAIDPRCLSAMPAESLSLSLLCTRVKDHAGDHVSAYLRRGLDEIPFNVSHAERVLPPITRWENR